MEDKETDIKSQMDSDKGFQSKRKVLVSLSLLFIGIKLSGITVSEANTFILKLNIDKQEAMGQLLFLALIYTFIRYYTYAHKYHALLFKNWSQKLLHDNMFYMVHREPEEITGLIDDYFPVGVGYYNFVQEEGNSVKTRYECRGIFRRYLVYDLEDTHDYSWHKEKLHEYVKFKWPQWANNKLRKPGLLIPKIIRKELYYQFKSYMHDRAQLDLLAPYILAIFAILCQFFPDYITNLLGITS